MPSTTYTDSLRLALPTDGELPGTWGQVVNAGVTSIIDDAISGVASIALSGGSDYTLSTTNGGTDEARNMTLQFTGGTAISRNIICPAVDKVYVVDNQSTDTLTIKSSAGTATAVVNPGEKIIIYFDGSEAYVVSYVVKIDEYESGSGTWTVPDDAKMFHFQLIAAGGSGGGGYSDSGFTTSRYGGTGGGGGACVDRWVAATDLGSGSYAYTVGAGSAGGAGGAAGAGGGASGTAGGDTIITGLFTAYGGGAGFGNATSNSSGGGGGGGQAAGTNGNAAAANGGGPVEYSASGIGIYAMGGYGADGSYGLGANFGGGGGGGAVNNIGRYGGPSFHGGGGGAGGAGLTSATLYDGGAGGLAGSFATNSGPAGGTYAGTLAGTDGSVPDGCINGSGGGGGASSDAATAGAGGDGIRGGGGGGGGCGASNQAGGAGGAGGDGFIRITSYF